MTGEPQAFFKGSHLYDPVAVLRSSDETLVVVRAGLESSRRFMILTTAGKPAWAHEAFASLSDVAWSLRAHEWQAVKPEAVGEHLQAANTLARLLAQRA